MSSTEEAGQQEGTCLPLPSSLPATTALLIIDVQHGFEEHSHWGGNRNNPHAEERIREMLDAFRASHPPTHIYHIHHHSTEPGSPLNPHVDDGAGVKPLPLCAPADGERVLVKHVNSGFIGTPLSQMLRESGVTTLVVCGLTTNHCVSTTTRMAGNLGFITYIVEDACATFDRVGYPATATATTTRTRTAQEVHEGALGDLHREFAWVVSSADIIKAVKSC
eukprot:TRINITY_DN1754_c0_g1_i1.p1 TRINITY_DN1754_c0_g1~~TRINITY_DN1754_c0_g1_i1.p1  ORF type:complete len:221 (-),score=52.76 TRINITY_DN1754_c0_g1_i1:118-780(-)